MDKKFRNKPRKPDEYYSNSAFELARFGKAVIHRNIMSEKDFDSLQEKIALSHQEICERIESNVDWLANEIIKYSPLNLLSRAYWEWATANIGKKSESEFEDEGVFSLALLEYLQCLIVSITPSDQLEEGISDFNWQTVKQKVKELFYDINYNYQICRTAREKRETPHFDLEFDKFRFLAQIEWCNVRGHRYSYHEQTNLQELLSPHSDIFNQLFNITIDDFIVAAMAIQHSLTSGLPEALSELQEFQEKTQNEIEPKLKNRKGITQEQLPDIMDEVLIENEWQSWKDSILGRCYGTDLFDLNKVTNLPNNLLDELSYYPGENIEFFAEGAFKGWPFRIWPTFIRPFVKIDNHYYCFNLHSFLDKAYRMIQKTIVGMAPSYKEEWNRKQKEMSESLPFKYLQQLLPGATVYKNIYFRMNVHDESKPRTFETDGIIIHDDCIFIIEVKAGAFTYTSPATDFESYINSIKELILKPSDQGNNFLKYLKSQDQVNIYDSSACDHSIAYLSHDSFRNCFCCAVTLDHFTMLASQTQELTKLKIDPEIQPVWTISVNDLRIYADMFDNPLIFLHFLEQRMQVFKTENVQTFDELDHLGLYLEYNAYTEVIKDYNHNSQVIWHGFVQCIDEFFHDKLIGNEQRMSLRQTMPKRFEEIIDVMALSNEPLRNLFSSILLNTDGNWRKSYHNEVEKTLEKQRNDFKTHPISSHGQIELTTFCWLNEINTPKSLNALDHSLTVMIAMGDKHRWHLELFYDTSEQLLSIKLKKLLLSDLNDDYIHRLKSDAEILKAKRVQKVRDKVGKIGRNDPCPCGSGKKYKRCCKK